MTFYQGTRIIFLDTRNPTDLGSVGQAVLLATVSNFASRPTINFDNPQVFEGGVATLCASGWNLGLDGLRLDGRFLYLN